MHDQFNRGSRVAFAALATWERWSCLVRLVTEICLEIRMGATEHRRWSPWGSWRRVERRAG